MTVEIIVLVLVAAFIISGVLAKKPVPGDAPVEKAKSSAPAAAPNAPAPRKLAIDGTEAYKGDVSFVSRFGLSPKDVREIRTAKGFEAIGDAPIEVRRAMQMLHAEGRARGPDIARLAAGLQNLAAGQAVYFVLSGEKDMVAFQDVIR